MTDRYLIISENGGDSALVRRLVAVRPQSISATASRGQHPNLVAFHDLGAAIVARWPEDCLRQPKPKRVGGPATTAWRMAIAQYYGLAGREHDFHRLQVRLAWHGVGGIESGSERTIRRIARDLRLPEMAAVHCAQQYEIQKILSNRYDEADAINLPRRALDIEAGRNRQYGVESLVIAEADQLSPAELRLAARLPQNQLVLIGSRMTGNLQSFVEQYGVQTQSLQTDNDAASILAKAYTAIGRREMHSSTEENVNAPGL